MENAYINVVISAINLEIPHIIEVLLILLIIVVQIHLGRQLWIKIKKLKDLNLHDTEVVKVKYPIQSILDFDYSYFSGLIKDIVERIKSGEEHSENSDIEDDKPMISSDLLFNDSEIEENKKIITELNTYILKNEQKMVNFNVIRDIVDRNYQVLDDDINQMLPTPLYLGLAATMLGIIFGLWGMQGGGESWEIANYNSLIIGVGIAMTSSFIGLVLTTVFSTLIYKNSKREAEEEKNSFYSMLQAHMLPELLRKGETGIEALNSRLDRFGKVSADSVERLSDIVKTSTETLESQYELMERVDSLDVRKVSTTSLKIFEGLEKNLKSFETFSAYWDKVNLSIGTTNKLIENLKELSQRFEPIEDISIKIRRTLTDYNTTMSFFTQHIEEIKKGGSSTLKAVSEADKAFEKAIEDLKDHMEKKNIEISKNGEMLENNLSEIGTEVVESLEMATREHLTRLADAYTNNIPKFEKLEQLDNLPLIMKTISENNSRILEQNSALVNKMIEKLEKTGDAIKDLNAGLRNIRFQESGHVKMRRSGMEKTELVLRMIATGVVGAGGIGYLIYNIIKWL